MKHVKLFESWMDQEKILVGYFADGGKGSHPAIIKESAKNLINRHPSGYLYFTETEVLSEMPEALLAIFDDSMLHSSSVDGWIIKGISNELANAIIASGETDIYASDSPTSREAFAIAGFEDLFDSKDPYAYSILAVIPNASINTVYWSNNPEGGGGNLGTDYWETPYNAIPLTRLLTQYK